jgi:hypothetical protein
MNDLKTFPFFRGLVAVICGWTGTFFWFDRAIWKSLRLVPQLGQNSSADVIFCPQLGQNFVVIPIG